MRDEFTVNGARSIRGSTSQQVTMDDIILLLPGARAYKVRPPPFLPVCSFLGEGTVGMVVRCRCSQGVDELGHNFFKLQAYFMTHFIYVVSEWGKHQLPQELFWEEVCFIMNSMAHVGDCVLLAPPHSSMLCWRDHSDCPGDQLG
jgi:hypothetical protein